MKQLSQVQSAMIRRIRLAQQSLAETPERGDVPGWVLIAVMTAGIVAALMAVVGPLLVEKFRTAIESVG